MASLDCPAPVYPANLPLAALGTAELLLVATLRLFALPLRDPQGEHPDWREGLTRGGIAKRGCQGFAGLFRFVVVAPRRALDVRCLRCQSLGEDEGRLLQLVSLLQRGRPAQAMGILADWLPEAAARAALVPARDLALAFAQAQLSILHRHGEAVLPAPGHVHADPGLALMQ